MIKKIVFILTALACMAASCETGGTGGDQDAPSASPAAPAASVKTPGLAGASTVSKGIVESVSDVAVYCQMQEQVVKLNVKEGVHVKKDDVLMLLNEENLHNNLVQARNQFEQASYQFEEILVGLGYKQEEFGSVPEYMVKMAKVKSGYNIMEESLRQAENQYEKRKVLAPVSGTVTDVKIHQYDLPQSTAPVCRIFDPDKLKVVFNILESEMSRISIGNAVSVTTVAYPEETHVAKVSLISPKIDDKGMIKIEAVLEDSHNLIPGMTALVDLR